MIDYFDQNWGQIVDQWVLFHTSKYKMFGTRTNNRIESLNQKLKAVITKYSSLHTFFNELMACISSIRIEHDIKAAELLMKKPIAIVNYSAHDRKYSGLLTEFAFEKYFDETTGYGQVQFNDIDDRMAVIVVRHNQRIITTSRICDCIFFTSMQLPCQHIIAFRHQNNIELFDPSICNDRWLKEKMDFTSQFDYVLDNQPQVEVIETLSQGQQTRQRATRNQKYRRTKTKCDELCDIMAELPEKDFREKFELLKNLVASVHGNLFHSYCIIRNTMFCFF